MISKISRWISNHEATTLGIIVALFLFLRLGGVHLPLHQDEYKWPLIANPANIGENSIPHPPLSEFIYRTAGYIVGFNVNFRFVPLLFGALNLLLLYYFMRSRFGRSTAMFAVSIWTLSYFSVLASLMVDTDGEIMPFFFLIALIGYYKTLETWGWKNNVKNNTEHVNSQKKWWWLGLLIFGCVGGFFIKVSFLLAIVALAADYVWMQKDKLNRSMVLKYTGFAGGGLVFLVLLLVVAHSLFPFFDLKTSVVYWEHFATSNRDWFQTLIQCAKAILYTSPFLLLVPFFIQKKGDFSRIRPFIFFLIFAFIFYIILFDFSLGALDRYLQLVILPLTAFSAVTLNSYLEVKDSRVKEFFLLGLGVAVALFWLQFLPHVVPPLHPKTEWISRLVHLKWNFLFPFSGGSGPLGFYVSFLFMALSFIVSIGALVIAYIKPDMKKVILAFLIPIGLMYNGVFIEEYVVGAINGSAPKLLAGAVEFIKNDPDIQKVTVYNDNGGNEIQEIGKYRKRLYVDPKFDINEKITTLNQYKEHYFVLDIPRIDPTSIYAKYFASCIVIYHQTDRKISATIYDCRNAPDVSK